MTLTSPTVRVQYSGDGNTASFAITYIIWDDDDPTVTHTDSNGIETTWVRGTQYNITLVSPPATATLVVVTSPTDYTPALGEKLTIKSDLANTQPTDLPLGGSFPSPSVEQQLDQTVRQIQQSEEAHNRSLQFPVSDSSSLSSEIPASANRASKYLTFDIFGEPTTTDGQSASGTSVTPTGSTITRLLADWFADVIILVESVQELAATDFTGFQDNGAIELASYHPLALTSALEGGGIFIWDAGGAKSQHDGGIIISPTVPWTWADDGVAYLAGTGETDSGGNGVFVRVTNDELRPEHFGARSGTTIDSTESVKATFTQMLNSQTKFSSVDGGGKRYGISAPLITQSGAAVFGKTIRNIGLVALSGFTGDHIFQLAGNGTSSVSDLHFTGCYLVGGPTAAAAYVKKIIDLDNVSGCWIQNCEIRFFSEHGILSRGTQPATELFILDNRIEGNVGDNTACIGIEIGGNDSGVERNLIRSCFTHCYFLAPGNSFIGNHIYNTGADRDVYGLIYDDAKTLVINNNYIDNVRIRLDDPKGVTMTGNKFLLQNGTEWTGVKAFVVFKATAGSTVLENVTITGNVFKQTSGTALDAFGVDESAFVFDYANMVQVYIRDNVFERFPVQTSHPTAIIAYSTQSSRTADLSALSPFGSNTVYKYTRSAVWMDASTNTGEVKRTGLSANVVTVVMVAVSTGNIIVTATVNSDGQ